MNYNGQEVMQMTSPTTIPEGYMTVGTVAKKMGVSVRTLQYYDREGILSPSSQSEGGRRLYSDKDVIQLHQILSMKHLGFSLDDIKNRLIPMDTPLEVAHALTEQAGLISRKIQTLSQSLEQIEALRTEVLQIQKVDFKKYADIIVNLQMKNEYYWLIKHFDDDTLDYLRSRFDQDRGVTMMETFRRLQQEAVSLYREGIPPDSPKAQSFAKAYWDMISEFTGGDAHILAQLIEMGQRPGGDAAWQQGQDEAMAFIGPALDIYFRQAGIDIPEEVSP